MAANDRYVYIWREQGIANSGLPFYVGIGTHRKSTVHHTKYYRAYQKHLTTGHADTFAQRKANKLKRNGMPHIVEIYKDNISKEEAASTEILLINRLGRICNKTGILTNIGGGGSFSPLEITSVRQKHKEKMAMLSGDNCPWGKSIEYDGITYNTKNQLEKVLGIDHHTLNRRLRNNKSLKRELEYNGKIYNTEKELYEEYGISKQTYYKRVREGIPLEYHTNIKKVKYRGIIYKNISELARFLGIDRHLCSDIVNRKKEIKEIGEIEWLEK